MKTKYLTIIVLAIAILFAQTNEVKAQSYGDPQKTEEISNIMLYAGLGLAVTALAAAVVLKVATKNKGSEPNLVYNEKKPEFSFIKTEKDNNAYQKLSKLAINSCCLHYIFDQ